MKLHWLLSKPITHDIIDLIPEATSPEKQKYISRKELGDKLDIYYTTLDGYMKKLEELLLVESTEKKDRTKIFRLSKFGMRTLQELDFVLADFVKDLEEEIPYREAMSIE